MLSRLSHQCVHTMMSLVYQPHLARTFQHRSGKNVYVIVPRVKPLWQVYFGTLDLEMAYFVDIFSGPFCNLMELQILK